MTGFPDKAVIAELTAKMLLEVDAVRFMADKPFIYTSGWASPIYTDCRRLISFPRVRQTLIDFGVATVMRDVGFEQFDSVAGGEVLLSRLRVSRLRPPIASPVSRRRAAPAKSNTARTASTATPIPIRAPLLMRVRP